MSFPTSKKELAVYYNLDRKKIGRLFNFTYRSELDAVGYDPKEHILSPNVVRKFIELHGLPLTDADFNSPEPSPGN